MQCVHAETTVKQIEDTFKDFTTREDIAIVLINQFVRVSPGPSRRPPFAHVLLC